MKTTNIKKLTIKEMTDLFLLNQRNIEAELLRRGTIIIGWSKEDVIAQAEADDVELTKDEITDVLSMMSYRHDATIGVNWDVISYHISRVVDDRENKVFVKTK